MTNIAAAGEEKNNMEKMKCDDDHPAKEEGGIGLVGDEETTISPQAPSPMGGIVATDTTTTASDEDLERRKRRKERHERHERERERRQKQKEIAEQMKNAMNQQYLEDPRKRLGRDYEQWQAGQVVHTPEKQQKLTILRRIDDGHAGVVFRVRDDDGNILALKVPRKESEKQFKKLHQEVAKNARMQSLGLPIAEITEEGGDYLVKRWIDGLRGDHWFIQWNEKGRPLDDLAWRRLCEMFDMLAAQNVYVQNLKDLNMIWDGQKWVVIDVGYFKTGLTPQQALGRYYETFDGRWNKPRYNRGRFMFLCPTIAALRGHSHPQHYIKRETTRDYYRKKSKTSVGDEVPIPVGASSPLGADGRKAVMGNMSAAMGGSSEALNDIKRKQAEAAMAVLERAKNRKKKKKRQAAAAAAGEGEGDTTTTPATPSEEKNEDDKKNGGEEKSSVKKRGTKEEEAKEKKDKETVAKAKKEKDLKEKKEKKDKELQEKKEKGQRDKELKEKEKKEKEQQKKKK